MFSDSHGDVSAMKKVIDGCSKADMIFHLGDYDKDAREIDGYRNIPVHYVAGNCDFGSETEELKEVFVAGNKILLTHGHNYGVKFSPDRLIYLAQERDAKAVFFGHTHQSYMEYVDGIWLINPGSISDGRWGKKSYAFVMAEPYGIIPKIMNSDMFV